MLLAIDIGNSSVTTALASAGALGRPRRMASVADAPHDLLADGLDELLAADGASPGRLAGISLASVVPSLTAGVEAYAARHAIPLLVAGHATVPIPVRVDDPASVGADRLVDAYAAGRLHGTPAVVLDLGTATTLEAVGTDGAYLGGPIAPGLELGLESLARATALLPRVEARLPAKAIATNTVEAIRAGTVLGHRELAAGLLRLVRGELADATGIPPARIVAIATGGLAAAPWVAGIEGIDVVDPALLLKGLVELWSEVGPS